MMGFEAIKIKKRDDKRQETACLTIFNNLLISKRLVIMFKMIF